MTDYKNPYGKFTEKGSRFNITERDIPRNWFNYMWNDDYIAFISQAGKGEGMGQDRLGQRIRLIKQRKVYISDGEEFWSTDGLPVDRELQKYECIHSLGASTITMQYRDIETNFTLFVPREGYNEVWLVNVKNNSAEKKSLKVTSYAATDIDGKYEYQGYNQGVAEFNHDLNSAIIKVVDNFNGALLPVFGYMASSDKVSGYDTRHNTFIGPYDTDIIPRALKRGRLENNDCHSEKCCMALENSIELMPGEEKNIVIVAGFNREQCDIEKSIEKYCSFEKASNELSAVLEYFKNVEKNTVIETPDASLNNMWNNWLKHVTVMGSQWARIRHNGIRDLTQDSQCMAVFNPELAFQKLKRVMSFQYSNGYAPRKVIDGVIKDDNFSDNCVWLAMAVRDIVAETGNKDILFEEVEFNDGTKASVYEHVKRSIEFLYNFRGLYNLIKIWGGDWNDCMNRAGLQGKGVSIWLSMAWCMANDVFCELAEFLGNAEDAELSKERGIEMRQLINEYGWDGEYYLTTYTDDGIKIGTHEDTQGKIFLMPQIWSVMANVCDGERKETVLNSIEKYLKTPLGTLISNPGFSECRDYLGYMSIKEPGAQENGGVYLQPICWKMIVDNITKNPEEMGFDIETILPFRNKEVDGRGEPYILYNSYNSNPDNYRYATPGQSWRTATSQWFVNVMVKYVFGLNPDCYGIKLTPCIPAYWDKCRITKELRGSCYTIEYIGNGCDIEKILINGEEFSGEYLPNEKGMEYKTTVFMK